jgi:predicted DCC family thiol-disulfide oxidoreductase YuxK
VPRPPATMLYDADCSICTFSSAWLARRVSPSALQVMALQDVADARVATLVAGRSLAATLHVVLPDDRVVTGARAVIALGRLVPRWRWLARAFDHRLGHWLLEPGYRFVAGHRRGIGRVLGLPATCPIPTAAERP